VRVLVTGAAGFLGSHVAEGLAARGHHVVAHARRIEQFAAMAPPVDAAEAATEAWGHPPEEHRGSRRSYKSHCEFVAADLVNDVLFPLVEGCDAIVHCAALSSPWGPAAAFDAANVLATERLLAASRHAGVRRFVHIGSPSIYFRFEDRLAVGEDFTPPKRWITDYARTKWESELRVQAAAQAGQHALVLRPRAVFGPRDNAILPRLLKVAERGWFPLVHRGQALIDVTCVGTVVQAAAAALDADAPGDGRAYNLSNGEPLRVVDLVTSLFAALHRDVRLVSVPRGLAVALAGVAEAIARRRAGCPEPRLTRYGVGVIGYSQTLDITRARRELGYAPATTTAQGIGEFAHWWKAHAPA
jgi:nucleoside-diphosphate-sugar epimerase